MVPNADLVANKIGVVRAVDEIMRQWLVHVLQKSFSNTLFQSPTLQPPLQNTCRNLFNI